MKKRKKETKEIREALCDLWVKLDEILEVLKKIHNSQINDIHAKVLEVLNTKPAALNCKPLKNRRNKYGTGGKNREYGEDLL